MPELCWLTLAPDSTRVNRGARAGCIRIQVESFVVGAGSLTVRVSVIIVNFNGRHLLRDCLEGLRAQIRVADELIVVDNASTDDSVALMNREFPEVRVIQSDINLGFAGGNNLGIRASSGDIVVLLNNDTIPSPGFLEEIAVPLEFDPTVSSVAGVMLFSTRVDRVATTAIEVFENGLALDQDAGKLWRELPHTVDVFGPSAGAAAYRRSALQDVGLFPEPYFLYLEDVDLAWRLRMRRHKTVSRAGAWALHIYSASSGEGSPLKDYYLARNRAWALIRCWPSELWRRYWGRVLRYEIGALGYAAITGRWASIRGRLAGWMAIRRLWPSRRRVQSRATSAPDELLYWVSPAPSVRNVLRARRVIQSLIGRR
jgi:GT2 family glycosyltransferase